MIVEPIKPPSPVPGASNTQTSTGDYIQPSVGSIFGRVPKADEPPVRIQQSEHLMSHWSLDSQCFHADCRPTTVGDVMGPRAGKWAVCTLHSPLQAMAIKVLDEVSYGGVPLSLLRQVIRSTPAELAQVLVGGEGGTLGAVIRPIGEKAVKLTVGWWRWKCRVACQQLGTPGLHLYPPIYLAAMTPEGEKLSDSWARAVTEVRAQRRERAGKKNERVHKGCPKKLDRICTKTPNMETPFHFSHFFLLIVLRFFYLCRKPSITGFWLSPEAGRRRRRRHRIGWR
jgi:hypothetical protein